MKTILAPIDFSAVSDAVVEEASALARAIDGRVVLLAVTQPPVIAVEYSALIDNIGEIKTAGEKYTSTQLAKYEAEFAASGITTEAVQLYGAPVSHIVEQAKAFSADYIVMGSHGHTALYDLLVGSTTHGVLLRATCPVVIIPAKETRALAKARREHHAII